MCAATTPADSGSAPPAISFPARPVATVLEDAVNELHRLGDAAESIADVLVKWDREDLLRADALYGGQVPALGAIATRLHEIGTLLNITPDDVERLGLVHPGSPDLDGIERALGGIAAALGDRDRPAPTCQNSTAAPGARKSGSTVTGVLGDP